MTSLLALDYLGVFVFAITGALVASAKRMDIFGFLVLALMPAVGGGTMRDVILDVPVFWTEDTTYLYLTFAAAVLTYFSVRVIDRLKTLLIWLDALGLSVFCVLGAAKALSLTGDLLLSIVLGVVTAVAGGIVRDVIANDVPLILHREIYATAAIVGASVFVLATELDIPFALWIAVATAMAIRSAGIVFQLSIPNVYLPRD